MNIYTPVSVGEVFDKLSVLHIKLIYIADEAKRKLIQAEISSLHHSLGTDLMKVYPSDPDYCELFKVNQWIWEGIELSNKWNYEPPCGEDEMNKRLKVYRDLNVHNNLRFKAKQRVNERFDSSIKEVKSHL